MYTGKGKSHKSAVFRSVQRRASIRKSCLPHHQQEAPARRSSRVSGLRHDAPCPNVGRSGAWGDGVEQAERVSRRALAPVEISMLILDLCSDCLAPRANGCQERPRCCSAWRFLSSHVACLPPCRRYLGHMVMPHRLFSSEPATREVHRVPEALRQTC